MKRNYSLKNTNSFRGGTNLKMNNFKNKNVLQMIKQVTVFIVLFLFSTIGFAVFDFTSASVLNSNAFTNFTNNDYYPKIATDGSGNWVAIWYSADDIGGSGTDFDIFSARSTDNGANWTTPIPVNTNAGSDTGVDNEYHPQIVTDGLGNWIAIWYSWSTLSGGDADIFISRSINNGASWSSPQALTSDSAVDDTYPQIATDCSGTWIAVWASEDTSTSDDDIFFSISTNNGVGWTTPGALNTNAGSDSHDDYYPYIATDGADNWVTVWTSLEDIGGIGSDQDIIVSYSSNDGGTWSAPQVVYDTVSGDMWSKVVTDKSGHWITIWESLDYYGGFDFDIVVSQSTDNGVNWSAATTIYNNSGHDHWPHLTTDNVGNWLAVWTSEDDLGGTIGTDEDILISLSTNNGTSWTTPAYLNSNAPSDTNRDFFSHIVTDLNGHWIVSWGSEYDLGGSVGNDCDIFVSTSDFTPVEDWIIY